MPQPRRAESFKEYFLLAVEIGCPLKETSTIKMVAMIYLLNMWFLANRQ